MSCPHTHHHFYFLLTYWRVRYLLLYLRYTVHPFQNLVTSPTFDPFSATSFRVLHHTSTHAQPKEITKLPSKTGNSGALSFLRIVPSHLRTYTPTFLRSYLITLAAFLPFPFLTSVHGNQNKDTSPLFPNLSHQIFFLPQYFSASQKSEALPSSNITTAKAPSPSPPPHASSHFCTLFEHPFFYDLLLIQIILTILGRYKLSIAPISTFDIFQDEVLRDPRRCRRSLYCCPELP